MTETVASLSVRIGADTSDARTKLKELERLGGSFGRTINNAFADAVFSGESFGQTLRSLALDLSRVALRSAVQPFTSAIGDGLAAAFAGLTPFAKGGVVGTPMPKPFAAGGVIASPMTFPLGSSRMGLAGEAGPEAIMPLARGADGRLGVRASGGQGGGVTVTMNITTSDAESFRRSETQIGAMLARAVGRGQRNL